LVSASLLDPEVVLGIVVPPSAAAAVEAAAINADMAGCL